MGRGARRSADTAPGTQRVVAVDTTLCDGGSAPGVEFTASEQVEIARQLVHLGVDLVEVSCQLPHEAAAVRDVAEAVDGVGLAARCVASPPEIDRAWEAVRVAARPRLTVAVDVVVDPQEAVARTRTAVAHARARCPDVELRAEGAPEAEPTLLRDVCAAGVRCGATTVELADVAGRAVPAELAALVRELMGQVAAAEQAVWSVHCHDDLGLASAGSLAGLAAGARQVRAAVNGLGPRAGTAALEQVVMALRAAAPTLGLVTGVRIGELARTSRLVALVSGLAVPPNRPVVGAAVVDPREVGWGGEPVVLGPHASRGAFEEALEALGVHLPATARDRAYGRFRELAARKPRLGGADLVAIATEESAELAAAAEAWAFQWLAVAGGTDTPPRATARLARADVVSEADATGDGMIDAACNAVATAVGIQARLVHFSVAAVTSGTDAVGDVSVQVDVGGRRVNARGVSTDVVEASARAFLHAINKVIAGPQPSAPRASPAF
jgi:2-isopropylmalate synthase